MKKRAARKSNHPSLDYSRLEPRNLLAAFSEIGSNLNIDLLANESIGIISNNSSYSLTLSGTATWNGTNNANVTGYGTSTLTITAAGLAAFDTVNVNGSATNASVAFNNSGASVYSDTFTVSVGATGSISFNGTSSFIGQAGLTAISGRNIVVHSNAALNTADGDLILKANESGTTTGGFAGLRLSNSSLVQTQGLGNITLIGRGGDGVSDQYGVWVQAGSQLRSTAVVPIAATQGQINISGWGGPSISGVGVLVEGIGTTISSVNGNINVNGTGGTGLRDSSHGFYVRYGAKIESTGNSQITINATGGAGNSGIGAFFDSTGTRLTSIDGAIVVNGVGGSGPCLAQYGVYVRDAAQIEVTGSGEITIDGQGGPGQGGHGLFMNGANSTIRSNSGNMSISGRGGVGTQPLMTGILLQSGSRIESMSTGNVDVIGIGGAGSNVAGQLSQNRGITIASGSVIEGGTSGLVSVNGTGGDGGGGSSNYGVGVHANSRITSKGSDVAVVGVGGSSGISSNIGIVVDGGGHITSGGVGSVSVDGTGGHSNLGSNIGVRIDNATSRITSSGGNVSVVGQGGTVAPGHSASSYNVGVWVTNDSQVRAEGAGSLSIQGTGGASTAGSNYGVIVQGSQTVVDSSGGDVLITGQSGSSSGNQSHSGVYLIQGSRVSAGGSGSLTIHGTGGTSTSTGSIGVEIRDANTTVTSSGGNVSVTGQGGNSVSGGGNAGVWVINGAKITAGGLGNISVDGTSGFGPQGGNNGILVWNTNSEIISNGGNVTLTGIGGSSPLSLNSMGVNVSSGAKIAAVDQGSITITGTGGASSHSYGVAFFDPTTLIQSQNGDIFIQGFGGNSSREGGYGVYHRASRISTATGNITVEGHGGTGVTSVVGWAGRSGVNLESGAVIQGGTSGFVRVDGFGGTDQIGWASYGVTLSGSSQLTSHGANVVLNGTGGNSGNSINYGVSIGTGSLVTAGGSGTVSIHGTGGATTGGANHGVIVDSATTLITSSGGNVSVTGLGGSAPNGTGSTGVLLLSGSQTTAGGNGTLTVQGTGGISSTGGNVGIDVREANTQVTSGGGNVILTGQGGYSTNGNSNAGVWVINGGTVTAGGLGHVSLNGTGGVGLNGGDNGIVVWNSNSLVTSSGGDVTLNGQGGGSAQSSNPSGVNISGGGKVVAVGNGAATVIGRGGASGNSYGVILEGATSSIQSNTGNIFVQGFGGHSDQSGAYGVYLNAGAQIETIGSANITVEGHGGTGTTPIVTWAGRLGVYVTGGSSIRAGSSGILRVTGIGGDGQIGWTNDGVRFSSNSLLTATGADIIVNGTGGNGGVYSNYGVSFFSGSRATTGGSGSLTVNGTGGQTVEGENLGVYLTGTNSRFQTMDGRLSVDGRSVGNLTTIWNTWGVLINSNASVSTETGDILIVGAGGISGTAATIGVNLSSGGSISTTDGAIIVRGTGGNSNSGSLSIGVNLGGSSSSASAATTSTITAGNSGTITIEGNGGSGNQYNHGIRLLGTASLISAVNGNVNLKATRGSGINSHGVNVAMVGNGGTIRTLGSGAVNINSDSVAFGDTASINAGNNPVSIRPLTNGAGINLGSTIETTTGTLELSDSELNRITASTINIGNANSGPIDITAPIILSAPANVNLTSGGAISYSAGSINTAGGSLFMQHGTGAGIGVANIGTDVSVDAGSVSFASGSVLNIAINGTAPDSQYHQLQAAGNIDLTGVNLVLAGTHVPASGEQFTIVNNTGTGTTSGTFNGLAEGAIIPNFLGSGLAASISYVGGDGNDVVLDVVSLPPTANDDSYTANVFTLLVANDANGTATPGNQTDNGVLANDSAPAGPLSVSTSGVIITHLGATVTMNADGTFTYDATSSGLLTALPAGQSVVDSFAYTVTDGFGQSDTATVSITVNGGAENAIFIIDSPAGDGSKALVVRGSDSYKDKIDIKEGSNSNTINVKIKNDLSDLEFNVPRTDVSKVIVYGLGGDDDIKLDLNMSGWLFGGAGDDKIRGGDLGDILIGGDGDDKMDGKGGRDILIGGDGEDKLKGQADQDILIGGWTAYDNYFAALAGIQNEWNSANSFQNRVENIFNGSGSQTRANRQFFLNAMTVQVSDGDKDELQGGDGADWFIADLQYDGDKIKDDNDDDIFGLYADWFDSL